MVAESPKPQVKVNYIHYRIRKIYFTAPPNTIKAFSQYGEIMKVEGTRPGNYAIDVHDWFNIREVANFIGNYKPDL